MSDTGYYYVSLSNWQDIEIGIVSYSVIWKLLHLPNSIFLNRISLFFGLAASASYLLLTIIKLIAPNDKLSRAQIVGVASVAIGCVSGYYRAWIPDPSYNSVGLLLNLILISVIFRMVIFYQKDENISRKYSILSGFILLALAFTRPQTALLMAFILGLGFIFLARPSFVKVLKAGILSIFGMLILCVLISVLVEPITSTAKRLMLGLEYVDILEISDGNQTRFARYRSDIGTSLSGNWIWCLLLSLSLSMRHLKSERFRQTSISKLVNISIFAVLLGWYLHKQFSSGDGLLNYNAFKAASFFTPIAMTVVITGVILILGSFAGIFTLRKRALGLVSLILILALFAQIYLTGNRWFTFSGHFGVYPLFAIIVLTVVDFDKWSWLRVLTIAPLLLYPQIGSYYASSQRPYRLFSNLAQQTIPTPIRGGESLLLTSPTTHQFLTTLTEARESYGSGNEQLILIDATGTHPFIAFHIGAKPTSWPWLLSGYSGSQNMFDVPFPEWTMIS